MNTKDLIINRLESTHKEHIKEVIDYMEKEGFFKARCNGHHTYPGGLADHAWQTYLFAQAEMEAQIREKKQLNFDENSLAICALLHDFCKCQGMRFIHGHGQRSARMLQSLGLHLSSDEFLAIRFHMSLKRHLSHPCYSDALHCSLRHIIHLADGLSARKRFGRGI